MSFFIGLSKSPAVPAVSRDTSRRPSSLPPRSSFFPSRPKLNTLESERLNLSAITRSFPSSSIKARLGQLSLSPLLLSLSLPLPLYPDGFERTFEEADIQESMETNISAESVTARVCVDGNSRREPPSGRMDGMKKRTRERKRGRKRR